MAGHLLKLHLKENLLIFDSPVSFILSLMAFLQGCTTATRSVLFVEATGRR